MQALGERTPRKRAERRIQLPESVGQRDRQVELYEGVVEVPLQRGV